MFFWDWTYILVIPGLLLGLWAQARAQSTYAKYSRVGTRLGRPASEVVDDLLRRNGNGRVSIGRVSVQLTDHYDPAHETLNLSTGVYGSSSVAALGVAAHEAGHAVQYAQGYAPVRLRSAIVSVTNLSSQYSMVLLFIGLFLYSQTLFGVGILLFSVTTFFQLITLPVEFNASRRAMDTIESQGLLDDDEAQGAGKVLRAAAMTYVAALLASLLQLLRFLVIFLGRGGGSDRRGGRR